MRVADYSEEQIPEYPTSAMGQKLGKAGDVDLLPAILATRNLWKDDLSISVCCVFLSGSSVSPFKSLRG